MDSAEPPQVDLFELCSCSKAVAQRIDMDHGNLGRVLAGEYRLHLDLVEKIYDALGLPLSLFHRRCLQGQRLQLGEAAALIAFCRPRLGRGRAAEAPPRGPFLATLDQQLPDWLEAEAADRGPGRREELLLLEEERFKRPREVKAELETLSKSLLAGPPTRGARAELALAVSIWSTLRRIEGRRDEARDGYLAALRCLAGLDEAFCEGFLLIKAASVAIDFDQLDSSILLLDGASAAFVAAGDLDWQARVFVEKGIGRSLQERWPEAESDLRTALRLLPTHDERNRFAAATSLADLLVRSGRLPEAQEAIRSVADCCSDLPLAKAFLTWRRGKILAARNAGGDAAEALWAALALMGQTGDALDVALIAADLAELLLKLSRKEDLRKLVHDAVSWMGKLASNKSAHRAWLKLVRLFYAGELDSAALKLIQRDLQEAGRPRRPTGN